MLKLRWIAPLLAVLPALGGCALPPAVALASYSADIVSYAASGKTVTDHLYSAAARSDCSFIRVLHAKPICVDAPAASAPATETAAVDRPQPTLVETPGVQARDTYVTLGSFLDSANAERTVAKYADFHPAIVAVVLNQRHFHRVVAGPLSTGEAATLRTRMSAEGSAAAKLAQSGGAARGGSREPAKPTSVSRIEIAKQ
jgi:cell division septation protein DedD